MKLTPEDLKQIRLSLLRYGLRLRGIGVGLATSYLRAEGFLVDRDQVTLEIKYLAGHELLAEVKQLVSPEMKSWDTTSKGRDYLAEQGLDE